MKILPIKSDSLPRPRCTPAERAEYDKACELEKVNVNSNARDIILQWARRILNKHGVKRS